MRQVGSYFSRVFSWGNALPLLIVALALVVSLKPKFFGVEIQTENMILTVLGFLALDAVLARAGLLSEILQSLGRVEANTSVRLSVLRTRKELPRMESIVDSAQNEIFIVGINLEGAVVVTESLIEKIRQGRKVRLLALDPQGKTLDSFCTLSKVEPEIRKSKIINNLRLLAQTLDDVPGNWEIRVVDSIFPAGCIGIDIDSKSGQIIAQHYLYRTPTEKSPIVTLRPDADATWFGIYKEQLEQLWKNGKKLYPTKTKGGNGG